MNPSPPDIAVAFSEWSIIEVDDITYVGKQFQLREDLLGTEHLSGWVGLTLDPCHTTEQYTQFDFEDTCNHITDYTLQCGVLQDTTQDDMEIHWPEVTSLFRSSSMCYVESE